MRIDPSDVASFFDREELTEGMSGTLLDVRLERGNFGEKYVGTVDFAGRVGKLNLNKTSLKGLTSKFGNETELWKSKQIRVSFRDTVVNGRNQETLIIE